MLGKKPDEYIREPFIWETNQDGTYETSWMTAFESTDRQTLAVENQIKDKNSLYHHYKELIHVRRSSDVLISGEIKSTPLDKPGLVMFERLLDKESLFVVHNMTSKTNSLDLNEKLFEGYKEYKDVYFSTNDKNSVKKAKIQLEPYSTIILEKK
jgi:glycosidase